MANRTANYSAFYVKTPFDASNLGAYATRDFVYYNQLRAWKGADSSFPFVDAHAKTYNVRDDSSWDTLKKRLHERLDVSKNIVLFLSANTKNSQALREEIDYGINTKGLPVIVVYPDFKNKSDICGTNGLTKQVTDLWNKLPIFRDSMSNVAIIHVPYKKSLIESALSDSDFKVQTMTKAGNYYYKLD
ncbi:TIR domain-containing protein [Holdemanella biformis]|uniref:TIR domain-containing protein n=1 Tax=Holdemanella biformis TaxID=1735 RepID=UPI0026DD43A5|nr:TIR domain-containing protein [Holdemanella biformis]